MSAVDKAGTDRFTPHFLVIEIEWDDMVDAWQLDAVPVASCTAGVSHTTHFETRRSSLNNEHF
jgi:hypothetical protein